MIAPILFKSYSSVFNYNRYILRKYLLKTKYYYQRANIYNSTIIKMSKSKFEYVKSYEIEDKLLMNVWIVVRIDGKGFHR